MTVTRLRKAGKEDKCERPLFLSRVAAGSPVPADHHVEETVDLSEELIDHETATFFVRASGSSMEEIGIYDGDLLLVDRSVKPEDGSVIIAALDGELTVKRYVVRSGEPMLVPESDAHEPIPLKDKSQIVVWGVVSYVIHEV